MSAVVKEQTLKALCANVQCEATYGAKLDWNKQEKWQQDANGYSVQLKYAKRTLTVDFWMGSAHTKEPTAEDVIECLLADASGADQDFENWCLDYAYDTDSRRAERIYQKVQSITAKLRKFLGEDFGVFLNAER